MKREHPDREVQVWLQDEARIGQQGTLARMWAEKGSRPTALEQTEHEWAYLFAAVNPRTGQGPAMIAPTVNTAYMNERLAFISRGAGPAVRVVLVLDQAGWHVAKGLKVPRNLTLLHLPSGSRGTASPSIVWRPPSGAVPAGLSARRKLDVYKAIFQKAARWDTNA